jgi:type IV secretory pathway component VirB8
MFGMLTINLKNMKKTKKQNKEYSQNYYQKNKFIIKERSRQLRERRDTEQKLYKYGFFTLLAIILAHLILIQF